VVTDFGSIAAAIGALGSLLMAFAAIAAATAAWNGLETWKKQSVWAADNDLAKRAMLAMYRYRDSLHAVRHMAMNRAEMALPLEDGQTIWSGSEGSAGVIAAYIRRWEKHSPNRNQVEAIVLEADAVWGPDLRRWVKSLLALENELLVYIRLHMDAHLRGDTELAASYREILARKRDILYDFGSDEDDVFRRDFSEALMPVENFLREKLGRAA